MAPDAAGDSLHVGLDGQTPATAADLTGFTDTWEWSKATMAGGDATLDLTATGKHTLEAYMREDGLRIDRVLLVTDTNYVPSGLGPAESPLQTITETVPGGLGTTSISYGYDALYRLTGATYSGAITATFAYNYDSVGNMMAFTETVDAQTTSVSRTFDAANRLEYAVEASGTTTYTFDANGNLIELLPPGATGATPVGGVRYDYDQRNLMVGQETNPDGAGWVLQAAYVYDGAKDRLQQVDYTGATPITTTYVNDIFGLTQVLVADDGTNEVYNLFGLDLINQDSGAEVRTLLVDGLGSVRLEMVGNVVEVATTYSPYGEVLEQAGASGTVYGFTGEQEDGATGLLYLRARYFNAVEKVFQSHDAWRGRAQQPLSYNGYLYVFGNPVNRVDPNGMCPGCSTPPPPPTEGTPTPPPVETPTPPGYVQPTPEQICPEPRPAPTPPGVPVPQPRKPGFSGYAEGYSMVGSLAAGAGFGEEVVYDFATFERANFDYGMVTGGLISGVDVAAYASFISGFDERNDIVEDYSGEFLITSMSVSVPGPLSASLGYMTFTAAQGGRPSAGTHGNGYIVSVGAQVFELPASFAVAHAQYEHKFGTRDSYVNLNDSTVDIDRLSADILSGRSVPFTSAAFVGDAPILFRLHAVSRARSAARAYELARGTVQ